MSGNLKIMADTGLYKAKEELYIKLRKKEGRLYSDEIVKQLPAINLSHPLAKEWKVRANSVEKLKAYLTRKGAGLKILDLGCGNGWMSNALTKINDSDVTAIDLNLEELNQGARVFSENEKLHFVYVDIYADVFPEHTFDAIICSAAIQYFPDLKSLINRLLLLLKANGEIHFIDGPLYNKTDKEAAKGRSRVYFAGLGFEDMISYYHHHTWDELEVFNYKIKKDSIIHRIMNKISGTPSFPWIMLKS